MIYTREEVKNMLENIGTYTEESIEYFIDEMTSIEISDDEIEKEAIKRSSIESIFTQGIAGHYFELGAKWYREQLKK